MEETTTRLDKEEKGRECQPHHIGTINDTRAHNQKQIILEK